MSPDATMPPLRKLGDFELSDLESVALILQGSSVIDWQALHFRDREHAGRYLSAAAFDPNVAADRDRLENIKAAAVEYLRRNFEFPIPRPVEEASVVELLLIASGKGHRQLCACVILKAMHIIHHVEARELLFTLAMSDQDVFRLVEERVYRLVGHMLSDGLPITEFVGGRKRRDSIYTKLLSKREAHASAVYDKLRFRIVTRTRDDILPVLLYLTEQLFPFNYVVPGESINTIFQLRSYVGDRPRLAAYLDQMQDGLVDELTLSDNIFSAESYGILHFVVDLPVRVPDDVLNAAPQHVRDLGPIIFGMCEFQMVDRATEEANEGGDASHARYKNRQRLAVRRRLRLGKGRLNGRS
jgi:uncharacterized protein (TIGR04552 family)